ncbi:T9SS type A sorting domain-containing protein [Aureivirga sp. CE67]|uniref:T9SS type A sorting domain-containing protein n=1 Tax=Aureivirga sp. CE67 TaxID=1788983 RepID=UPI0018CADF15|nr:T9SS type A sorting domain-containing protein [Aureivirga sp. CE67]
MNLKFSKIILFLFFASNVINAQTKNVNFFTAVNEQLKKQEEKKGDEGEQSEGGTYKMYEKMKRVWGPRLSPHGDFSIAAKAMGEYYDYYNESIKKRTNQRSSDVPNWRPLGPTKNISDRIGGKQVGRIDAVGYPPEYDGQSNKTYYVGTPFGGLWKTKDDGYNWEVANTDQLPIASVSDIAFNKFNGNHVFISTGIGDLGGFNYGANAGGTNPYWTMGVYRSMDSSETWEPINGGLYEKGTPLYEKGGVIRRIISDPNNPNIMFAATSVGIYKTTNAMAQNSNSVEWYLVFNTQTLSLHDEELKGLEFKPDDSGVIYASGRNIYRSKNGGNIWEVISNQDFGLNLDELPGSNLEGFRIGRINIAVTPADPNRLYAYVVSLVDNSCSSWGSTKGILHILELQNNMWDTGQWEVIHEDLNPCGEEKRVDRIAIAASEIDPNLVYYGTTIVKGRIPQNNGNYEFKPVSKYWMAGFHPDVHAIEMIPNSNTSYRVGNSQGNRSIGSEKIVAGHDGGVSVSGNTFEGQNTSWEYRNNGLNNTLIWCFDDYEFDKDFMIISLQDNGTWLNGIEGNEDEWDKHIFGGDGYGVQINDYDKRFAFLLNNGAFKKYDYLLNNSQYELNTLPPNNSISTTFKMDQMPQREREIQIGFSEIYRRLKDDVLSSDTHENIWKLKSDIVNDGNFEHWNRQITDYIISDKNPNYQYIATRGNTLDSQFIKGSLYRSTTAESCDLNNPNSNCFKNITNNIPVVIPPGAEEGFTPVITGIAIDPENPERVWVSLTGYYKNRRVFYSDNAGDTWTNADPNGKLAELRLPANNIVYQEGSNDRLYLATDAGVYTKDANSDWYKYGDLPNVRVTELKINRCNNLLRASTYGRGLWEIDLIANEDPKNDYFIDEDKNWDVDFKLLKNLRIKNNSELTVESNVEVLLPAASKVVVEEGSKLIVEEGASFVSCGECAEIVFEVEGTLIVQTDNLSPKYRIKKGRNAIVVLPNGISCNSFEEEIIINGSISGNYTAANEINSNNSTYNNNNNSHLKSGREINLTPGLYATSGFFAEIIPILNDCVGGDCDEEMKRANKGEFRQTYFVRDSEYSEESYEESYENFEENIGNFEVYPIPFENQINFKLSDSKVKISNVKLFDTLGKVVYYSKELNSNKIILENNLSKGVYILSLEINGKVYTKKIAKK